MNSKLTPLAGKLSFLSFFSEARIELKKVTWPSRKQVIRLSLIVIAASLATGAYLGTLDYLFTELLGIVLNR